jgi:2-polyprenyl-3-methyl-5-hydroxy-6-metoxy-1,4-benzoquinol methylase
MYNEIESVYHLIYPDWDKAIHDQSASLYAAAEAVLARPPIRVLDVSCGIGTQALGLAGLGCSVTASDLSDGAIARARQEAEARDLVLNFEVCDMRDCFDLHGGDFDLVLSADNSIPHLAGSREVKKALTAFHACLRPKYK